MQIIICSTLKDNLINLIPTKSRSCSELLSSFLVPSADPKSDFCRHCTAAKFIFDDVINFAPKNIDYPDDLGACIRRLRSIPTEDQEGLVVPFNDWYNTASSQINEINLLNEILSSCIPSYESKDDMVILSSDPFITNSHINQTHKPSKEIILGLLAASGIALSLPPIIIKNDADIELVREKFEEERIDYLLYINNKLSDFLSEATSTQPKFDEIYDYAKNEFALDLKLKSQKIAAVANKKGRNTLKLIYKEFLNQAPSIGAATLKNDIIGGGKSLFKVLLSASERSSDFKRTLSEFKEAAYVFRIGEATKGSVS